MIHMTIEFPMELAPADIESLNELEFEHTFQPLNRTLLSFHPEFHFMPQDNVDLLFEYDLSSSVEYWDMYEGFSNNT